ncbi:MAG: hypothetical protein HY787_02435, partial [Deltaproteobacteria bacterium]|nr:hypothetical protein [Deltaproteobacteria bacterium]
ETEKNLTLTIEMTKKTGLAGALITGFINLGALHYEMGRYQEAQESYNDALVVLEQVGYNPSLPRVVQMLKVAAGIRGGFELKLDGFLNFDLPTIRMKRIKGMAAQAMGECYLYIDESHKDEAETWIKKAIEIDEQNRMPWDLARDYALYAEFFKKKGDPTKAKEKLSKAIDLMTSIGADGWVERYEKELAELK